MNDLPVIISLVLFFVVWWLIARRLKPTRGFFARNALGLLGGFAVMIIAAVVLVDESTETQPDAAPALAQQTSEGPADNTDRDPAVAQPIDDLSSDTSTAEQTEPQSLAVQADDGSVPDLAITPTEFLRNLNVAMGFMDLPFAVATVPDITIGSVNDAFNVLLNDNIAIVGVVSKESGNVMRATLMGAGDGSPESGVIIMGAAVSTFMARTGVSTQEEKEQHIETFLKMMQEVDFDITGNEGAVRWHVEDTQYSITPMDELGTWFTVQPAT